MKNTIPNSLFLFMMLFSARVFSQNDIPIIFAKQGHVQTIDYASNRLLINFVEEKMISKDKVYITDKTLITNADKKSISINDIKSNDEVMITGKFYPEAKRIEAEKIAIVANKDKNNSIDAGRIEFIRDNIAYVDGRKIRLGEKKEVKGKEGYATQTFASLDKLNPGMMADVSGTYKDGAFIASSFSVAPELKTENDAKAEALGIEQYNKIAPTWNDKSKRSKLFNFEIEGVGKIYANAEVQEYVNAFGQKLVPAHMKKKVDFIFVVIDNPDVNAVVHANGLAYVYTGLLKMLENEAQFAAVLGHEIAHTMYEHTSKDISDTERAEKKKTTTEKITKGGKKTLDTALGWIDRKTTKGAEKEKNSKEEARDTAVDVITSNAGNVVESIAKKQLSNFSVKEETQADRVGLCIMAVAGYDPREAPKVWKNIYSKYGVTAKKPGVSFSEYAVKELTKDEIADNEAAEKNRTAAEKETTASLVGGASTHLLIWQMQDNEAKSYATHADAVERFVAINRLVALYWNDEALLSKAIIGTKEYAATVKKLRK